MKSTIQKILWGALIIVWGGHFGASFLVRRQRTPYTLAQEYVMGFFASAIVLVGVGLLTYRFARKQNSQDPMKVALAVSTFIALVLGIGLLIEPYLPSWLKV